MMRLKFPPGKGVLDLMSGEERLERIQNATAVLNHIKHVAPGAAICKIIKREIREERRLLP